MLKVTYRETCRADRSDRSLKSWTGLEERRDKSLPAVISSLSLGFKAAHTLSVSDQCFCYCSDRQEAKQFTNIHDGQ